MEMSMVIKHLGLKTKAYIFIGNSRVKFEGDNLEIGGKIYKGTPGLLELISMEKTNFKKITNEDKDNYLKILKEQAQRLN